MLIRYFTLQSCGGTLEVLYEDPKEDVASILSGGIDDDDRRKLLNPDDVRFSFSGAVVAAQVDFSHRHATTE